jgi:hypothetical protein
MHYKRSSIKIIYYDTVPKDAPKDDAPIKKQGISNVPGQDVPKDAPKDVPKDAPKDAPKGAPHIKKEKAENLSECEICPILNPVRSAFLNKIVNEFWEKFKDVPFTSVCESLVDDKEVLVVFMDLGTPNHLPAKFKGFPVFVCYAALELNHHSFHKELIPGISIGNLNSLPNASAL